MVLEYLLYFAHHTPKASQLISDHRDHLKILKLLAISILHLVLARLKTSGKQAERVQVSGSESGMLAQLHTPQQSGEA